MNFLPLWLIVIAKDVRSIWFENVTNVGAEWCGIIGIVTGILVSVGVVIVGFREKQPLVDIMIKSVVEQKSLSSDVLLCYVLPLLAFKFTLWMELAEFLIFFLLLVALAWRHKYMSGNAFLELCGFRFYSGLDMKGNKVLVLTRHYWVSSEVCQIKVKLINTQVYYKVM